MSLKKKVFLTIVLIAFVGISLFTSLNILSRATYEFKENEELGGYEFSGFNGNSGITELHIDKVLTKVKNNRNVEWVPDESKPVTSIRGFTVSSDEHITRIYIGADVRSIGEAAFTNLWNLKEYRVDEANEYYVSVDGVLFTKDMKTLVAYPPARGEGDTVDADYDIPDGVEILADNCFYKCDRLHNVTIPEGVKEIGRMAFFKCYGLNLVELPSTIEVLEPDCFSFCTSMKYAFFIPASMKSIDHHAFYKSDALEAFYVESNEEDITLGSKWMPKSENAMKSDDAIFGASRSEYEEYNAKRISEEEPSGEENNDNGGDSEDSMNNKAVIILVVFAFIPGLAIVGIEVIRKLFKDDFLMTRRGKEKLARMQAEKEAIHNAYVNGEITDEDDADNNEGEGENDG